VYLRCRKVPYDTPTVLLVQRGRTAVHAGSSLLIPLPTSTAAAAAGFDRLWLMEDLREGQRIGGYTLELQGMYVKHCLPVSCNASGAACYWAVVGQLGTVCLCALMSPMGSNSDILTWSVPLGFHAQMLTVAGSAFVLGCFHVRRSVCVAEEVAVHKAAATRPGCLPCAMWLCLTALQLGTSASSSSAATPRQSSRFRR
jgi:hypothetical protein